MPYGASGRDGRVLGSRVGGGVAVDRRGRGEGHAYSGGGRGLEQPLAREDVPAHVDGEDVAEARHARLSRQMEHAVEPVQRKRVLGEVDALDRQPGGVRLLQRRVVVVRERIPADRVVPALEERALEL